MNNDSAAKIKMLQSSQKCLVFGLLSLVTLVGVPFAVMAAASRGDESSFSGFCFFISVLSMAGFPFAIATIFLSTTVRAKEKRFWNAARPYRILGDVCSGLAIIASFVIVALTTFLIMNSRLFGNAY